MTAPPTNWLEYVEKGGVTGILLVMVGALAFIGYRLYLQKEALHQTQVKEIKASNEALSGLLRDTLETQTQTSLIMQQLTELIRDIKAKVDRD